jgi:hypothetical protein
MALVCGKSERRASTSKVALNSFPIHGRRHDSSIPPHQCGESRKRGPEKQKPGCIAATRAA